ncbi:ANTAR domain-containing protein [Streptomyces sp. NPDC047070]|uniref:ANTAR domain-containing protein n=1 Tax=Streptomyces sp. NPDC047070 TaxID=3154923 RepID=UPI0034569F2B
MSPSSRPSSRRGNTEQQFLASHDTTSRNRLSHTSGQPPAGPVEALSEEVAQLRTEMERRSVIDMARGMLMARWSCSEDDTWQILVNVSQHTNTTLHDIAEAVPAGVHGEPLPIPLQEHLAAAVARLRAR